MPKGREITIFLAGDVMTGRGIDQILAHPANPILYEPWVKDSRDYLRFAEEKNGPIPRPVSNSYIWGDALKVWKEMAADALIINLETTITASENHLPEKDIHYRMHPENIGIFKVAGINCCVLANNHILDWGEAGLMETVAILKKSGIQIAGAGQNEKEAKTPAILNFKNKGRVLVLAYGHRSAGVPSSWAARSKKPGVNFLPDFSCRSIADIKKIVSRIKQAGDIAIFSIHWGGNWGYEISNEERIFAHRLIDEAGIDIIYGHSSHHPKGIEVYKNKPILYGCGDFLNDYEGIGGYESFRDDLTIMYFVKMNPPTASLISLQLIPMQIRNFRLNRAAEKDTAWLLGVLNREGKKLNTHLRQTTDNALVLAAPPNHQLHFLLK